jgi:hypothetical protein
MESIRIRGRNRRRGLGGTRPNRLLPHWVSIRTDHADVTGPGFWEADTVAHCGPGLADNFPCAKLQLRRKTRPGSRLRETYYPPRTPYAVLLACPQIPPDQKTRLRQTFPNLDRFALKDELKSKLRNLFHQLRTGNPISESSQT